MSDVGVINLEDQISPEVFTRHSQFPILLSSVQTINVPLDAYRDLLTISIRFSCSQYETLRRLMYIVILFHEDIHTNHNVKSKYNLNQNEEITFRTYDGHGVRDILKHTLRILQDIIEYDVRVKQLFTTNRRIRIEPETVERIKKVNKVIGVHSRIDTIQYIEFAEWVRYVVLKTYISDVTQEEFIRQRVREINNSRHRYLTSRDDLSTIYPEI